jgi:ABC-type multidrug transport system fused ATPase/permease subunit
MPGKPNNKKLISDPIKDVGHYFVVFQTYLGSRIYLIFLLTLLAAIMEGFGILMLLPLLHGLDGGLESDRSAPDTGITVLLHDWLSVVGLQDSVLAILVIITVAFLTKGVLVFFATGYNAYLRGQLLRELKEKLYNSYSQMNYSYYSSQNTGYFINIINAQTEAMLLAFKSLTKVGAQILNSIIYLALAFAVAWRFGLMALILGIVLLYMFRSINIYARNLSRKTSIESGILEKLLIQALQGYKYLASTGQSSSIGNNVSASIRRLTRYKIRSGIAGAFTTAVKEPILVVFVVLIVMLQSVVLQQPLAPILVSILLFQRGLSSILNIQIDWQQLLNSAGGIEMVRDELLRQEEFRERTGAINVPALSEAIVLENVHFGYGHGPEVLRGINLTIPVRTSVALVGESGAGKSTILDLITLMLEPNQGEILIDRVPAESIDRFGWRRQIGYVSQEAVIFDDTIANNICLWTGDPADDAAIAARIEFAARQAYLADFIDTLPDRYSTRVGDRGMRLSGGQRQRLFIARELFRNPSVLILDEATSALDSESESAIQRSIEELQGRVTLIIIAHRLSTIRHVDQIFVIEAGTVVEQGTYQELREDKNSRLSRLASLQQI